MQLITLIAQTEAALPESVTETATELVRQSNAAGSGGTSHLILLLTVFVLAVFVGVEIITKIPPTLHTPLMSGSNAISGITVVGAILAAGTDNGVWAGMLGFCAVVLAMVNVVGGFVVTNRMLAMFKARK